MIPINKRVKRVENHLTQAIGMYNEVIDTKPLEDQAIVQHAHIERATVFQ
jgi:hypothetical protein